MTDLSRGTAASDPTAPAARQASAAQIFQLNQLYARAVSRIGADDAAAAVPLLQSCLRLNPGHYKAVRTLAAMAMQTGAGDQGRALLRDYFQAYPLRSKRLRLAGTRPTLLSVRGFSGSDVIPWRNEDGEITTMFRGGHFSTQFLIAKPDFPEHVYTIAAGNILAADAVPRFDLLLNKIADPDVESETLADLQTYLGRHPETAVINAPAKVFETTREANYRRLRGSPGITFPETHRLRFDHADADLVAATIRRLGLDDGPVILRATGTHTARTTALIRSRADIDTYVGDRPLSGPHYLIRYIDRRWRGDWYRKLRLFCIDGRFYPTVCHIDRVWNVHGGNRKDVMRGNAELMDQEKRFLLDWRAYVGRANADRLETLIDLVGLDFFGIDFNVGPDDDGVLIYEMNPAMRHSYDHARNFPYKMPFDMAITQAFTDMVNARLTPSGP